MLHILIEYDTTFEDHSISPVAKGSAGLWYVAYEAQRLWSIILIFHSWS